MLTSLFTFSKKLAAAKGSSLKMSHQVLQKNTYQEEITRGFRTVAGKPKKPLESIVPSITEDQGVKVQSDTTGYHNYAIVQSCKEKQCHKRLCDSEHETVCPYKSGDKVLASELGGALTHKVPSDKQGVLLDKVDADGKPKPQYLVVEKTTGPVDMDNIKQNEKMTEFVQQPNVAQTVADNLSKNSALALKSTSVNDTPLDEEL